MAVVKFMWESVIPMTMPMLDHSPGVLQLRVWV